MRPADLLYNMALASFAKAGSWDYTQPEPPEHAQQAIRNYENGVQGFQNQQAFQGSMNQLVHGIVGPEGSRAFLPRPGLAANTAAQGTAPAVPPVAPASQAPALAGAGTFQAPRKLEPHELTRQQLGMGD